MSRRDSPVRIFYNARVAASFHDELTERLAERDDAGLRRRLRTLHSPQGPRVVLDGRNLLSFCSNDYLGLANHPLITAAAREAIERWGFGAGASRLVAGTMAPHTQLERQLAAFKRTEAALVCSTGYQANLAAIRALAGQGDVIYLDRLNHGSIMDGAFSSGARVRVFPHRDYDRLERLLSRETAVGRRVIVSDTVFSMDGDLADLHRLVALKQRYDALLCIDEAHATGVLGPDGRGVAELMGVESEIDVVVGTMSKALGSLGGFIAGSFAFIDWAVNTAGPFIYTTALPAAACAAASAALEVVQREPERRRRVMAMAERLRGELHRRGFNVGDSATPIVPLMIGDPAEASRLSLRLEQAGLLIPAIRPPTVPRGTARLRISMCAGHTEADLDQLLAALDGPGRCPA